MEHFLDILVLVHHVEHLLKLSDGIGISYFSCCHGNRAECGICNDIILGFERMFIYCNATDGATVSLLTESGDSVRAFTGPFFTELEPVTGEVNIEFMIVSGSDDACRISLYSLNESALNSLKSLSGTATDPRFMIDVSGIEGTCTIVLPYAYDDTKIRIDGISCDTFDYCGKLATTFVCNNGNIMEVSIERKDMGILPGILVSVFIAACLVAIPVAHMYNEKKKVTGEGTESNA